jgi:hypothetical protein
MFPSAARLVPVAFLAGGVLCWPILLAAQQVGPTPQPESVPTTGKEGAKTPAELWAIHGQTTFVTQYHPGFPAAFGGPNSLASHEQARETFDLRSMRAGVRGAAPNYG